MKNLKLFAWVVIVCLAACRGKPPEKHERAVPVDISVAITQDVPVFLETIGNVFAGITIDLKPQVQGEIIETKVKQGQYVKAGQTLYKIDPKIYQANVQKANAVWEKDKAQLVYAKQKLERYSQLKDKQFVSALTIEELEGNVKALEAQVLADRAELELAKINLEHTDVRAPIDGKISQFQIDIGNLVQAFSPQALTQILQLNPVEIRFSFPQKDFQEIRKYYQKNVLSFLVKEPGIETAEREGKVDFLNNQIDLRTGTILLKGNVPNKEEKFWPGAFVRVRVYLKTEKNALVVPSEAIAIGQNGPYLFVINEAKEAELRQVKSGYQFDHYTIVESGVKEGEQVVINGQLNLKPGTKVLVRQNTSERGF